MADFRVLGPLSVERSTTALPKMVRRLLGALLCGVGRTVSSEELIEALWAANPPPTAHKVIQIYVRRLRAVIGADHPIVEEAGGYRLMVKPEHIDAARFERLVEAARQAGPEQALGLLDEALRLWRGPAYQDVRDRPPAAAEARRLDGERQRAESDRAALALALDRHEEPVSQTAAGSPPPTDADRDPVPRQLPAAPTGFVGRLPELGALDEIGSGLAIVAGTAGVGKTALVLHWARRAIGRFPDGQVYVNLNGFSTSPPLKPLEALGLMLRSLQVPPERVPATEAEAAGLFRTVMAGRRTLVVLDNAHSAEQVRPLLPGAGTGLTLVTSRRNLSGLVAHDGAVRINLDVLESGDAEALLVRVLGGKRIDAEPHAAADLAQVCAHLPLALRVAAAHLNDSPHRSLADHVAALRGGDRLASLAIEGDERSAVRATLDLSYQDIPEDARLTFRLLGLAPVLDFSAPAVAALTGQARHETERQLGRLADAHLIERLGHDRYTFHDLLRLYAREHTSEQERDTATRRLCDWYVETVYAAMDMVSPHLVRVPLPRPYPKVFQTTQAALTWLDLERSNLVAAIHSAAEHGPYEASWLLAGGLRGYLSRQRFLTEWVTTAAVALAAANAHGDKHARASAHMTLAHAHRTQQGYREGETHLHRAAALAEEEGWLEMQAASMLNLGGVHYELGDMTDAVRACEKAYDLYVQAASWSGAATALGNLGVGLYHTGRLPEALSLLSRAIQQDIEMDMTQRESTAMGDLGMVMWHVGRPAVAHRLLVRAVSKKIAVGDRMGESAVLADLAEFYRHYGHPREGMELASRAVQLGREFGDASTEASGLVAVGGLHTRTGEMTEAIRCHQQALRVARVVGVRLPQPAALLGLARAYRARGEVDEALSFAGEALELSRVSGYRLRVGEALTLSAAICHETGDQALAVRYARDAARLHRETGSRLGLAATLVLLAKLGEQEDDISVLIPPSRIKPFDYSTLTKGGTI